MSRLIVSVDVEDWYHGPSVLSPVDPSRSIEHFLSSHADAERGYRYLDACLELLSRHEIHATFFWVAEYARRYPQFLRRVVDAGHEIACHGLCHYAKLDPSTKRMYFDRAKFIERTLSARKILEDMSGCAVTGYRAPNAYVSGAMIDWLEEAGFKYDSSVSVNSLYNKTDSPLRGVTSVPYYPAAGELNAGVILRGIVEFPWPYLSLFGLKVQTAGGPFLRLLGSRFIIAGLRQSLQRGDAVFYFHPIDLCREDIPIKFSPRRPFLWLFKGDLVKRRIERVLKEFQAVACRFEDVLNAGCSQYR